MPAKVVGNISCNEKILYIVVKTFCAIFNKNKNPGRVAWGKEIAKMNQLKKAIKKAGKPKRLNPQIRIINLRKKQSQVQIYTTLKL